MNSSKQCTICCEKYNEKTHLPKILSCGHTICKICLGTILKGYKRECPLKCKISLTEKNPDKYITNYSLLGDDFIIEKPTEKIVCHVHNLDLLSTCETCKKLLCQNCLHDHITHRMLSLDNKNNFINNPIINSDNAELVILQNDIGALTDESEITHCLLMEIKDKYDTAIITIKEKKKRLDMLMDAHNDNNKQIKSQITIANFMKFLSTLSADTPDTFDYYLNSIISRMLLPRGVSQLITQIRLPNEFQNTQNTQNNGINIVILDGIIFDNICQYQISTLQGETSLCRPQNIIPHVRFCDISFVGNGIDIKKLGYDYSNDYSYKIWKMSCPDNNSSLVASLILQLENTISHEVVTTEFQPARYLPYLPGGSLRRDIDRNGRIINSDDSEIESNDSSDSSESSEPIERDESTERSIQPKHSNFSNLPTLLRLPIQTFSFGKIFDKSNFENIGEVMANDLVIIELLNPTYKFKLAAL